MKILSKQTIRELNEKVCFEEVYQECCEDIENYSTHAVADCPICESERSLVILDSENKAFCTQCNWCGGSLAFLMVSENMAYDEAIEFLCDMYDINITPTNYHINDSSELSREEYLQYLFVKLRGEILGTLPSDSSPSDYIRFTEKLISKIKNEGKK